MQKLQLTCCPFLLHQELYRQDAGDTPTLSRGTVPHCTKTQTQCLGTSSVPLTFLSTFMAKICPLSFPLIILTWNTYSRKQQLMEQNHNVTITRASSLWTSLPPPHPTTKTCLSSTSSVGANCFPFETYMFHYWPDQISSPQNLLDRTLTPPTVDRNPCSPFRSRLCPAV